MGSPFSGPSIPKPKPPPAPTDTVDPFIKEMARQRTQRLLRQSTGSAGAFDQPGMKSVLGG